MRYERFVLYRRQTSLKLLKDGLALSLFGAFAFGLSLAGSYQAGERFSPFAYNTLLLIACGYFLLSTSASFVYIRRQPSSWNRALIVSLLALFASSVLYSILQGEVVFFFLPVLFLPAGTALGGAIALDGSQRRGDSPCHTAELAEPELVPQLD